MNNPSVGIIGLETTHPEVWIPALRERDLEIFAFDDGEITSSEYQREFCEKFGITLCVTEEELLERAPIVAIMNANFDRHVNAARRALDRGLTVFIDKPIAASDSDLKEIASWKGQPVVLGSSNRLDPRLLALRESGTRIHALTSAIGTDEPFGYAIHGVEMGQTVLGLGATTVRCISESRPVTFQVAHKSGTFWLIQILNPSRLFRVSVQLDDSRETFTIPGGTFHGAMIDEVLRVHAGGTPLVSPLEAVEAVRILRAGHTSLLNGGEWVSLDAELTPFSGDDYAADYRRKRKLRLANAAIAEVSVPGPTNLVKK